LIFDKVGSFFMADSVYLTGWPSRWTSAHIRVIHEPQHYLSKA